MKNSKILFIIFLGFILVACREAVSSKIYGNIKTGIFIYFTNKNEEPRSLNVSKVLFYKRPKTNEDLSEIIWEVYYSGSKINSNIQNKNLIEYGVMPKGYNLIHPAKKILENEIYYYSVHAGADIAEGCFMVKSATVIQIDDKKC